MNWDQIVTKITPYIVKIETQSGYGTGFLFLYNESKTWCGVATAMHVVDHAEEWQQPIRIRHKQTDNAVFLKESERVIFKDWKTDSAVVLFPVGDLPLPQDLIPLLPSDSIIPIGVEVGWVGFPAVAPFDLCFFSGNTSARQIDRKAYLIDGVAINGVSGGPVLYSTGTEGVQIVGTVSAYQANRATGEALPGLLVAQDVSHFHDVATHIKSIDEAHKKKEEFEDSQNKQIENKSS
ncbi:MAG: serine protease [Chlorobiales bacterium]|nr:serine protease [Chlorobiales bacterium]